jgi:PHP family Zn ribbon phosphoesterase
MELAADLHIHSALSPCADNDMTPNNIINMAILKGLDLISVTDHNSSFNLPALMHAAVEKGIMFIPGIEVQTKEEVHMLCYFKSIANAVKFGDIIYESLPDIKINESLFGEQLIFDSDDNITGKLDKLLLSSACFTIGDLLSLVDEYEGACIPAHIDRSSFSILSNLGFIPENLNIKAVEVAVKETASFASPLYPLIKGFRTIKSSDAHYLWDISERENFIQLDDLTMTNVFKYLKGL